VLEMLSVNFDNIFWTSGVFFGGTVGYILMLAVFSINWCIKEFFNVFFIYYCDFCRQPD